MFANDAMSEINQTMGLSTDVSVFFAVVTEVYPEKMTIDAYVPETTSIVYGAMLISTSFGKVQKSIDMPEKDSSVLICYTSSSGRAVALGGFYMPSAYTFAKEDMEKTYPGELKENSSGYAFSKKDIGGSNLSGGKYLNLNANLKNGSNYSQSLSKREITLSSEKREGFDLDDISKDTSSLPLRTSYKFYEGLTIPSTIYKPEAITSEVANTIINESRELISKVRGSGDDQGVLKVVSGANVIYQSFNKEESDSKIAEIEAYINTFILKPIGATIELQIGFVSNDNANMPSNRKQSLKGNPVIFSANIINAVKVPIGSIVIDNAANMDIDMANVNIPNLEQSGGGGGTVTDEHIAEISARIFGEQIVLTPSTSLSDGSSIIRSTDNLTIESNDEV